MNLSKKLCANIPFTEAISHNCSLSTSEPVAAPTEDKSVNVVNLAQSRKFFLLSTSLVFGLHPFLFLCSNLFRNAFRAGRINNVNNLARVTGIEDFPAVQLLRHRNFFTKQINRRNSDSALKKMNDTINELRDGPSCSKMLQIKSRHDISLF